MEIIKAKMPLIPTDTISIDKNTFNKLESILPLGKICPADIFIQKTIPLKDVSINCLFDDNYTLRIFIADNKELLNEDNYYVGSISINDNNPFMIIYCETDNMLMVDTGGIDQEEQAVDIAIWFNDVLKMWYRIQVLLLHPRAEILERKVIKEKLHGRDRINALTSKRKVKYIKRYYITSEDVDLVINGEGNHKYNRKCLSWYVVGHWREYQSGKRIFIQGFWKGELRDLKQNFDERERVIDG